MTPQIPPALAALKRYAGISGVLYVTSSDDSGFLRLSDVVKVWPTQVRGEAVAFINWLDLDAIVRDQNVPCRVLGKKYAEYDTPLYTHPLPSTAALRDALDRSQRRVVCAAIRLDDKLVVGPRHWDGVMHSQCDTAARIANHDKHEKEEQGFIDQRGVFMDRREAWKVADAAGQILFRCGGDGERLFSENLY